VLWFWKLKQYTLNYSSIVNITLKHIIKQEYKTTNKSKCLKIGTNQMNKIVQDVQKIRTLLPTYFIERSSIKKKSMIKSKRMQLETNNAMNIK